MKIILWLIIYVLVNKNYDAFVDKLKDLTIKDHEIDEFISFKSFNREFFVEDFYEIIKLWKIKFMDKLSGIHSLGKSHGKNEIYYFNFGNLDSSNCILITGMINGFEPLVLKYILLIIIKYLKNNKKLDFYFTFIPILNIDTYNFIKNSYKKSNFNLNIYKLKNMNNNYCKKNVISEGVNWFYNFKNIILNKNKLNIDNQCSQFFKGDNEFSEIEIINLRNFINKNKNIQIFFNISQSGNYLKFPFNDDLSDNIIYEYNKLYFLKYKAIKSSLEKENINFDLGNLDILYSGNIIDYLFYYKDIFSFQFNLGNYKDYSMKKIIKNKYNPEILNHNYKIFSKILDNLLIKTQKIDIRNNEILILNNYFNNYPNITIVINTKNIKINHILMNDIKINYDISNYKESIFLIKINLLQRYNNISIFFDNISTSQIKNIEVLDQYNNRIIVLYKDIPINKSNIKKYWLYVSLIVFIIILFLYFFKKFKKSRQFNIIK